MRFSAEKKLLTVIVGLFSLREKAPTRNRILVIQSWLLCCVCSHESDGGQRADQEAAGAHRGAGARDQGAGLRDRGTQGQAGHDPVHTQLQGCHLITISILSLNNSVCLSACLPTFCFTRPTKLKEQRAPFRVFAPFGLFRHCAT